jgi:hypothetical protein
MSLLDILEPPSNPWLQAVSAGKVGALPQGIRVVRYEVKDVSDNETPVAPPRRKTKLAELAGA